jgi:uncharacterized SAM-binding protein YcdF (DUF218 family)
MTIPLLVVLALLAGLLAWLKRRRLALVLGVATAVAFLAVGYGLPARVFLADLQNGYDAEPHAWGRHNAIILLGAGSQITDRRTVEPAIFGYARLVKALQVYHACRGHSEDCKIIASGGDTNGYGKAEAQVFGAQLMSVGVPAGDVIIEGRSQNTWQNAQFSAPYFARHRFDRAFLVTAGTHLRRAKLYFAHFGIETVPIRADYLGAGKAVLPSAGNFLVTDVAIHEYLGIWRYYVYNALGWNVAPTKPGAL